MSVSEGSATVLTCVAKVISAFHDAEAFIERIKLKRSDLEASFRVAILEDTVSQAPDDIEKEKQRGLTRFGKAFEDGDHTGVIVLQQITIQLQSNLLQRLRAFAHNNEHVSLQTLIDAADSGRDKTIAVMLELKQRLLQVEESKQDSEAESHKLRSSVGSSEYENSFSGSRQGSTPLSPPKIVRELASEDDSPYIRSLGLDDSAAGADETRQNRKHRHNSLFGRFRHVRADSGLSETSSVSNFPPYTDPSSASSLQIATRQLSTVRSRGSNSSASSDNLLPNPDNNYLGFCKGAAKLQAGDRTALQKAKEFNDGWSSSKVYYLACSNSQCAFAGHMDLNTIWTKVWDVSEQRGIKFRWSFLAKSHVCQSKAKNQQFAYQCLFCVFLGDQPPVLHGTDLYLEHVSEEHRGRTLGDVVLYRTSCVNDRVCDDSDRFDINLYPLGAEGVTIRKQSLILSDDLLRRSKAASDATDSTTAVEPWNQDLSDFHYSDGHELCETLTLRSFRSLGQG